MVGGHNNISNVLKRVTVLGRFRITELEEDLNMKVI